MSCDAKTRFTPPFDPITRASAVSVDQQNAGVQLFIQAGTAFTEIAPALEAGNVDSIEYVEALRKFISVLVSTAGLVGPPWISLRKGILDRERSSASPGQAKARSFLEKRLYWFGLKSILKGWDFHMWRQDPSAVELLMQIALGMAAVADRNALSGYPRDVAVEVLEDAFQSLSTPRTMSKYKPILSGWDMPVKLLQFSIMRMLCVLYRSLLSEDRMGSARYLFRHGEAAGIMIMTNGDHYAGHAEHAWNCLQKVVLGVMHVTPAMWEQARSSAQTAVFGAGKSQHDWELAPAAYTLVFFLTCGPPGQSFDFIEVQRLLEDVGESEDRLEAWGMKEHVMFNCEPKRWLVALRAEWAKARGKGSAKGGEGVAEKPQRVTLQRARAERAAKLDGKATTDAPAPMASGHLPVTDWRVWDQRCFGYYTWLEPPMQPEPQKCAMCSQVCMKVHRCDTCKLLGYCSSLCARAHMFDHDCSPAPKPWLSPPVGIPPPPPPELGEEGFMGFIPWIILKYAVAVSTLYAALYLWRRFSAFRVEHDLELIPAAQSIAMAWYHMAVQHLRDKFEPDTGHAYIRDNDIDSLLPDECVAGDSSETCHEL